MILNIFSYKVNGMIRNATSSDKTPVLQFCKNTFSWGDYVEQVWDSWISEGHLLLYEEKFPAGICHAFYTKNQVWIEGIRVNPTSRRQKVASKLVSHAESVGKRKNIFYSYMLIDVQNLQSLALANSLGYAVYQTWKFYSILPKINLNYDVSYEKSLDLELYPNYVKSWRWFTLDYVTLSTLYKENKIVKSSLNGKESLAILTDSEHFERTLIVTIFSGSHDTTMQILSFIQNYGKQENYERIQILSRDQLPSFNSLEFKISFHLMKKFLV